jgi:hypothetical protein
MFRFYIARQRYDAYLLADRLKQAGIRAHVFNEHMSSIVGEVPPDIAQPQVWLERESDRERAETLLRTMEAMPRRGHAPLREVQRGLAGEFRSLAGTAARTI